MNGDFVCSEINRTFPLTLDPLGKVPPEGVVFDNRNPTILQGVSTNIKSNPSLLHYTSAEDRALTCFSPSYTEIIIVHDNFCMGSVSRELEHAPR